MKKYTGKITQKKSMADAENNAAIPLQDNRLQSAIQKKHIEALANKAAVQKQANNTGLPDNLKSGIENLSGHAMNDVNVHYNSDKPAQLNAHAYAQGTDIHIASGQEKHLPHEAWHVVQQKQGRVKPTMQMKDRVNVNDDKGLEKEADAMGAKALQANAGSPPAAAYNKPGVKQLVVQRYETTSKGKLSHNGHLFLDNNNDLFASASMFEQANSIGGDVVFERGFGVNVYGRMLYKVLPKKKQKVKFMPNLDSYDEEDAKKKVAPKLPGIEDLESEFRGFILDHREEAQESPEKAQEIFGHGVDPHNIGELRQLKQQLALLAHGIIQTLSLPEIEKRINEYFSSQKPERMLMPNDCRDMAVYVAGFDAGSEGVETDTIAPGNVYRYIDENGKAEWEDHYAAIIMTDGADHITMENAAPRISDRYTKMRYDRSWFFEMYGPEQGQSFRDKYRKDMERDD